MNDPKTMSDILQKLSGNRGAYYDIFKERCYEETAEREGGRG